MRNATSVLVLLAILCVSACTSLGTRLVSTATPEPSPTPTPSPSPSPTAAAFNAPSDWSSVAKETNTGHVTFSLPPTWRALDLDPDTVTRSFQAMASANPDFAKGFTLDQMKSFASAGLFVYAFDFGTSAAATGFASNMNVYTVAQKVVLPVDFLAQANASQLDVQLKAKTTSTTKLRISGVDAVRNVYAYSLTRPNGQTLSLMGEQYYLVVNDFPHVLTFTTLASSYDGYRETFEQIALTYHVG